MSARVLRRSFAFLLMSSGGLTYLYYWSVWDRYRQCIYWQHRSPEACSAIQKDDTPSAFLWYGFAVSLVGGLIYRYDEMRYGKKKLEALPIKPAYLLHHEFESQKQKRN